MQKTTDFSLDSNHVILEQVTEETISSDDTDTDLVIDVETLYVQMASHRNEMTRANTEANKQQHKHWKPPKGSGLPASDVCLPHDGSQG